VSRLFVTGDKQTALLRPNTKHIEEVRRRLRVVDTFCLIAKGEVNVRSLDRREMFEDGVLRAPVEEVWTSCLASLALAIYFLNGDDAVGVGIRQPPQHDTVDDAEDRRARADPQRQRDDHDRGEPRVLQQPPTAITNVFEQRIEHLSAPPYS
jgi:hypothetical protein